MAKVPSSGGFVGSASGGRKMTVAPMKPPPGHVPGSVKPTGTGGSFKRKINKTAEQARKKTAQQSRL